MFRFAMNYHAGNYVRIATFWSMPNIDAEPSDTKGEKCFVGIDFCSSYWQAPLHYLSQRLFAFMTPNGVLMETHRTQGGCNSAAKFQ